MSNEEFRIKYDVNHHLQFSVQNTSEYKAGNSLLHKRNTKNKGNNHYNNNVLSYTSIK